MDGYATYCRTDTELWHKESLLNLLLQKELPSNFEYVFWWLYLSHMYTTQFMNWCMAWPWRVDADLLFSSPRWLVDSVLAMMHDQVTIVQPFEFCFHLERDEIKPAGNIERIIATSQQTMIPKEQRRCWRSFAANYKDDSPRSRSDDYDLHGCNRTAIITFTLYSTLFAS